MDHYANGYRARLATGPGVGAVGDCLLIYAGRPVSVMVAPARRLAECYQNELMMGETEEDLSSQLDRGDWENDVSAYESGSADARSTN